ncbi:MAG: UvrD-helicase domain-containing protein [Acidobacteria bacterium]|nr:UvrD-helicase domain-containing protein [Acidobacteriota bacterium]
MATTSLPLPFDGPGDAVTGTGGVDDAARAHAVNPRFNVALEASAGTGKTRVLVDRYINLLRAGVDPSNILAITFTRKAAAEMRERIMGTLRTAAERGEFTPARWLELRERTGDISISTIDAFCLSLLREFPLEADLDPAFSVADETELPRLVDEALDRALRACRAVARNDENVALAFSQLGERRARAGLTGLLQRRIVAPGILSTYLASAGDADLNVVSASRRAAAALVGVCESMPGGLEGFLESGPSAPAFLLLARGLRQLRLSVAGGVPLEPAVVQTVFSRAREHFLTQDGKHRRMSPYPKVAFSSESDWRAHKERVVDNAPAVLRASDAARCDLNVLVSRGIWRMYRIAEAEYRRTLDAHAILDFSDLLLRALELLRRMDDFAQSRYRLESRYHHVLVDEFQDTSRAQWELVSLLIQSWGEGAGLAHTGPLQPSIFIVGDRKQSIYGFRDADVSVLREAARHLQGLRPHGQVRHTISRSFRAAAPLLAFINDVCHDIEKVPDRADAFEYADADRFPVDAAAVADADEALGLVVGETAEACAAMTASEIVRLISTSATVRDRETGVARAIRAGDIGILFRTRESHREFEAALADVNVRSYVYKGLGFFDADEIKDVLALVRYLADPASDLCAAALMRSRFFGVSDEALRRLAPNLSGALLADAPPSGLSALDVDDRHVLEEARQATMRWRGLVDRVPAAELVDQILSESAYAFELRGARFDQARENLKKIRSLMRRTQNRGFGTLARLAAHLSRLAVGDDANAAIDALDAVNLMTVHAAKGLEFPVVFVVNLARGTGGRRDPVRVTADPSGEGGSVAVGDFQSEADDDLATREREETKRLLYVALSRARDRLYLGTVLKAGRMSMARGSLGEVLPVSLSSQFETAAGGAGWRASSGRVHRFRTCVSRTSQNVASNGPDAAGRVVEPQVQPVEPADDFSVLVPVTDESQPAVASADPSRGRTPEAGRERGGARRAEHGHSDRVVGTLVHRMIQRFGLDLSGDTSTMRRAASGVLRLDEALAASVERTATEVADAAVEFYRAISGRSDVRALYAAGPPLHEVPFTAHLDGVGVRGTIDCLIRTAPSEIAVLEFKTGRPRIEHRAQLEVYRKAAERLFPGFSVDARLVYAEAPAAG